MSEEGMSRADKKKAEEERKRLELERRKEKIEETDFRKALLNQGKKLAEPITSLPDKFGQVAKGILDSAVNSNPVITALVKTTSFAFKGIQESLKETGDRFEGVKEGTDQVALENDQIEKMVAKTGEETHSMLKEQALLQKRFFLASIWHLTTLPKKMAQFAWDWTGKPLLAGIGNVVGTAGSAVASGIMKLKGSTHLSFDELMSKTDDASKKQDGWFNKLKMGSEKLLWSAMFGNKKQDEASKGIMERLKDGEAALDRGIASIVDVDRRLLKFWDEDIPNFYGKMVWGLTVDLPEKMKNNFDKIMEDRVKPLGLAFITWGEKTWDRIGVLKDTIKQNLDGLGDRIKEQMFFLGAKLENSLRIMGKKFSDFGTNLKDNLGKLFDKAKEGGKSSLLGIMGFFTWAWTKVNNLWTSLKAFKLPKGINLQGSGLGKTFRFLDGVLAFFFKAEELFGKDVTLFQRLLTGVTNFAAMWVKLAGMINDMIVTVVDWIFGTDIAGMMEGVGGFSGVIESIVDGFVKGVSTLVDLIWGAVTGDTQLVDNAAKKIQAVFGELEMVIVEIFRDLIGWWNDLELVKKLGFQIGEPDTGDSFDREAFDKGKAEKEMQDKFAVAQEKFLKDFESGEIRFENLSPAMKNMERVQQIQANRLEKEKASAGNVQINKGGDTVVNAPSNSTTVVSTGGNTANQERSASRQVKGANAVEGH